MSLDIPWSQLIGLLILGVIAVSLWKAHRNPSSDFNVFDLLMENGRVSKVACVFMGTWFAITYVFIGTYLTGKMTEGLFTAYGGLFIVPLIARMFSPTPAPSPAAKEAPV